jgi:hypothetical protein
MKEGILDRFKSNIKSKYKKRKYIKTSDHLCDLVVRVLGYRSGGAGSIPGTTKKKVVGLERVHSASWVQNEELLDRKVAAPV